MEAYTALPRHQVYAVHASVMMHMVFSHQPTNVSSLNVLSLKEEDVNLHRRIINNSQASVALYNFHKTFTLSSSFIHSHLGRWSLFSLLCKWIKLRLEKSRGFWIVFPNELFSPRAGSNAFRAGSQRRKGSSLDLSCQAPVISQKQEEAAPWIRSSCKMGLGSGMPSLCSVFLHHLQPCVPIPGHRGPSSWRSLSVGAHHLLSEVMNKKVGGNDLGEP